VILTTSTDSGLDNWATTFIVDNKESLNYAYAWVLIEYAARIKTNVNDIAHAIDIYVETIFKRFLEKTPNTEQLSASFIAFFMIFNAAHISILNSAPE
jgi:hypothetical protein